MSTARCPKLELTGCGLDSLRFLGGGERATCGVCNSTYTGIVPKKCSFQSDLPNNLSSCLKQIWQVSLDGLRSYSRNPNMVRQPPTWCFKPLHFSTYMDSLPPWSFVSFTLGALCRTGRPGKSKRDFDQCTFVKVRIGQWHILCCNFSRMRMASNDILQCKLLPRISSQRWQAAHEVVTFTFSAYVIQ